LRTTKVDLNTRFCGIDCKRAIDIKKKKKKRKEKKTGQGTGGSRL
jgi:hypothetical protein